MRKNLRRALLALALAAVLPWTALAAGGDANIARFEDVRANYDDMIVCGCALEDALYLAGHEKLFSWRPGDADVAALDFALPAADAGEVRELVRISSDGAQLWALCALYEPDEDGKRLIGAELWPLEIGGGAARFGEAVAVDVGELTFEEGEPSLVQVNALRWVNGFWMMYVYDPYGEPAVYALDRESGEGWYVDGVGDVCCIAAHEDHLLIETVDYAARRMEFYLYDPEKDELEPACAPVAMAEGSEDPYGGLAYSAESGRLFYLDGGKLMAAEDFDFAGAAAVTELSMGFYDIGDGLLLPGDVYVCASYSVTCVRSTGFAAAPAARLVVQDAGACSAVTGACYNFGNSHGAAVTLERDNWDAARMVDAMMNRDASRDIFVLPASGEAYAALFERGFMAGLDDADIADAVARMYPAVQAAVTRDGTVVAVPVDVYGALPGLDVAGFERIGIARADVPDTWAELLELLPRLPEMLPEDGSVRIFARFWDQASARSELVMRILDSWRVQFDAAGEEPRYDDPELAALLEAALAIDYAALGLPEDGDEDEYGYVEPEHVLFQAQVGCTIGSFNRRIEPALLRAKSDLEARVPLELTVAFVNPYSKNRELAQEFLAEVLKNLSLEAAYNLSGERGEPVRDAQVVKDIEAAQARVRKLQARLEGAAPADAAALREEIEAEEREIEALEQKSWRIPAADIEWYRGHAAQLMVDRYNYLNAGSESGEGGELADLVGQLLSGRMNVAGLLKEIDRKARMRQMEGY